MSEVNETILQQTIQNLYRLPVEKLKEVNDFVSFLISKMDDNLILQNLQKLSLESSVFDFLNDEPDLYSLQDCKEVFDEKR